MNLLTQFKQKMQSLLSKDIKAQPTLEQPISKKGIYRANREQITDWLRTIKSGKISYFKNLYKLENGQVFRLGKDAWQPVNKEIFIKFAGLGDTLIAYSDEPIIFNLKNVHVIRVYSQNTQRKKPLNIDFDIEEITKDLKDTATVNETAEIIKNIFVKLNN